MDELPSGPRSAVVLAAGRGTRMRPVTDVTPKPLLPFFGAPLLDFAVAHVVRAGAERVAVNAHHLADAVERYVDGPLAERHPGVDFHVSVEPELLGTGGALARLAGWLGRSEPFWVVNSDAVHAQDLRAVAADHEASGRDATLVVHRGPHLASMANLRVGPAGTFDGIADAPFDGGAVYCGVQITGPGLLDVLPEAFSCVLRQGHVPWAAAGASVGTFETRAFWADVGTPERYLQAHLDGHAALDDLAALDVFE